MKDSYLILGIVAVGGFFLYSKSQRDSDYARLQQQAYYNQQLAGQRYINGTPSTMGGQVNQLITGIGSAVGGILSFFKGV